MPLILPNTIANAIPADGEKLDQNFDTITDWANQDAITSDGATAMIAPLLLPGAPTQPNQAATKGYVDNVSATSVINNVTTDGLLLLQGGTALTSMTSSNGAVYVGFPRPYKATPVVVASSAMAQYSINFAGFDPWPSATS